MMPSTLSSTLDHALAAVIPELLFHYTSPEGLIGILRKLELWASNAAFLNDIQEVERAVSVSRVVIENTIARGVNAQDLDALQEMRAYVGAAAKRYYVFSLTEERDLLSQWRAYCPPGGGYAIGLPSKQLSLMADVQGFTLSPCIYDEQLQYRILQEFVDAFLIKFRHEIAEGAATHDLAKQIGWEFGQHVARFGISLKHHSFREEKEWRLISPAIEEPHSQLDYKSSSFRVVPFFRFQLTNGQHPNLTAENRIAIVIGPTSDPVASTMAVQSLVTSTIGSGNASHTVSEIPYRNW